MKPIPYQELDLPTGHAQSGFRSGALPSLAGEASGAGLHGSIPSLTT